MQNISNNETFKLLQLSDPSRMSLSDLELPEITTQRKRKVRRKTRPRPNSHRQNEDMNSDNQCNRLIIWIAIFLISCWLLTLSYMLAVIHAESNRLETQIKKVALTSQNVPDALQKWHETSKNLEQNQTQLAGKLIEIQNYIEQLRGRFAVFEEKLNEKKDYPKDEKYVADFGADIKAVTADVEHIKDQLIDLQKGQTNFHLEIDSLKSNISEAVINATRRANYNETNDSVELKQAQTTLFNEIKSLSANVSSINDTLSQKTKNLSEDLYAMQKHLDALQDRAANMTSHVESIEMECNKKNKLAISEFENFKNKTNIEIEGLNNSTNVLGNQIESVRSECQKVTKTAKKDMPTGNDQILEALGADTSSRSVSIVSPNVSALQQPDTPRTTSTTTASPSNIKTSSTTESSTVVVTVAEGKPKLLSIQTISKPV